MNIVVRDFLEEDVPATAQIFYDAVHQGTRDFYDDSQRHAWASEVPDLERWLARLRPQTVLVAEADTRIVGFMTLTKDGCIDLAFVAPDAMGRGVATRLYEELVCVAKANGLARLWTDASHLARGFFERAGWTLVDVQTVTRAGVDLTNFRMEKFLR